MRAALNRKKILTINIHNSLLPNRLVGRVVLDNLLMFLFWNRTAISFPATQEFCEEDRP